MVVDIRYHLASLVAVFFALGLGILVGMSLASGGQGRELGEQWIQAIEKELEALRLERREVAGRLAAAEAERDLYRAFSADLVAAVVAGRLEGRTFGVVSVGENPASVDAVVQALERAGAAVVGPVQAGAVGGTNPRRDDPALPELVAGVDGVVAIVGEGDAERRAPWEELLREARQSGRPLVAVVEDPSSWRDPLDARDVPYLTHGRSPAGELSLVLLLEAGEAGRYGAGEDLPLWPKHLLGATTGSGGT